MKQPRPKHRPADPRPARHRLNPAVHGSDDPREARNERRRAGARSRARMAEAKRTPHFVTVPIDQPPLPDMTATAPAPAEAPAGFLVRARRTLSVLNEGINGTPPRREPRQGHWPWGLWPLPQFNPGQITGGLHPAFHAERRPLTLASQLQPVKTTAVRRSLVRTASIEGEDRWAMAMLSLPVLAMIVTFGVAEATRQRLADNPAETASRAGRAPPPVVIAAEPPGSRLAAVESASLATAPETSGPTPPLAALRPVGIPPAPPPAAMPSPSAPPGLLDASGPAKTEAPTAIVPGYNAALPEPLPNPTGASFDVAVLAPVLPPVVPSFEQPGEPTIVSPLSAIPLPGRTPGDTAEARQQCIPPSDLLLTATERADPRRLPPVPPKAEFGALLAAAARSQVADLVVYDERYRRMSYPMGDVSPFYGVCTDVVIRAYRALGIDLQYAVQMAGVGDGDTNVAHRRTETLRRFFTKHGESLPVTDFAEDYLPGDIVTYYRPQNSGSRSHIAVVSDVLAPSGRYMIVHNRGWGPQLEDGLFVDEITGHYRYRGGGPDRPPAVSPPDAKPGAGELIAKATTPSGRVQTANATEAPPARSPSPKLVRAATVIAQAPPARAAQVRPPVVRVAATAQAPTRVVRRVVSRGGEFEPRPDFGLGR